MKLQSQIIIKVDQPYPISINIVKLIDNWQISRNIMYTYIEKNNTQVHDAPVVYIRASNTLFISLFHLNTSTE